MAKKKKQDKEKKKETELPAKELKEDNAPPSDSTKEEGHPVIEGVKADETEIKPQRKKNCECRKIGRWWYCMKQDHMGHLVLCDGPFKTQAECDELAVGDE
jgi:hypothetical protein